MDRPQVAYASWITRHWLHQALHYAFFGALLMLPASYFGLMSERAEHQLVRSLVAAVFFGVFFGSAMAGIEEWGRRRSG
jgi:hypothetical protein